MATQVGPVIVDCFRSEDLIIKIRFVNIKLLPVYYFALL